VVPERVAVPLVGPDTREARVRVSPISASVSLARRLEMRREVSSVAVAVSATAIGASLTGVIVRDTVAVFERNTPSETRYVKLSDPL
jgi:hypothetical protein